MTSALPLSVGNCILYHSVYIFCFVFVHLCSATRVIVSINETPDLCCRGHYQAFCHATICAISESHVRVPDFLLSVTGMSQSSVLKIVLKVILILKSIKWQSTMVIHVLSYRIRLKFVTGLSKRIL